ncbi:MAG TPA: glycosyltransferase [Solirubrobacteraceae bacterium]|jgi:MGT family glycosyltransferase
MSTSVLDTSGHDHAEQGAVVAGAARTSNFLLATWDGGGHAGPMLSVARALLARGHRVRVLADPSLRDEVVASGARFVPWQLAPHRPAGAAGGEVVFRDTDANGPAGAATRARDGLICGPAIHFAADCRRELHRERADVVVADHMLPGALVAAEAELIRTVSLATTLMMVPEWGVPAMGLGLAPPRGPISRLRCAALAHAATRMWRKGLPAYNAARVANHLDPIGEPLEMFSRWDRVLICSSAAIEFPTFDPPAHVSLVGARLDDPAWASTPWAPPRGEAPLVLVGLSSSFMDQGDLLTRTAAALGRLRTHGVVTTGPAIDPATVAAPANVTVVRSAPHAQVLRHASAVVTHGGHGTVAKALAAGVPVVALPLGRDQHDVAQRVVTAGAGLRLDASSSPERIAAAVRTVLERPEYARAARRVADVMAAERREDRAVAALEALVLSR